MKNLHRACTAAVGVAVAVALSAGGSFASPVRDPDTPAEPSLAEVDDSTHGPTDRLVSPREALAATAEPYAQQYGLDLETAMRRLSEQEDFGRRVEEIRTAYPQRFVAGRLEHEPEFLGTLHFFGAVPSDVVGYFDGLDLLQVELRSDASQPREELLELGRRVHESLVASGYSEVVTAPDPVSGTISAEVLVPEWQRDMSEAERRALLPPLASMSSVEVTFSTTPVADLEHTYAGAKALIDGTDLHCTTGFTVERYGVYGVLTAGHCKNDREYQQPWDGIKYEMPSQNQHKGSWGDFQWHTTPHGEYPEMYLDWGVRGAVTGAHVAGEGFYLAKFGRTTGKTTSTVYKMNVSSTVDGITYHRLVAMKDAVSDGGDSGGPWYNGTAGYGVHHGQLVVDGVRRSGFSQTVYVDEALLGAQVLVQ